MKRVVALAVLGLAACAPREPAPVPPPVTVAPPEPPAVVVRVKQVNGRFVAEVVDVRGTKSGAPPPDAAARKEAVDRLRTLLGERVRVVDPAAPAPAAATP